MWLAAGERLSDEKKGKHEKDIPWYGTPSSQIFESVTCIAPGWVHALIKMFLQDQVLFQGEHCAFLQIPAWIIVRNL